MFDRLRNNSPVCLVALFMEAEAEAVGKHNQPRNNNPVQAGAVTVEVEDEGYMLRNNIKFQTEVGLVLTSKRGGDEGDLCGYQGVVMSVQGRDRVNLLGCFRRLRNRRVGEDGKDGLAG